VPSSLADNTGCYLIFCTELFVRAKPLISPQTCQSYCLHMQCTCFDCEKVSSNVDLSSYCQQLNLAHCLLSASVLLNLVAFVPTVFQQDTFPDVVDYGHSVGKPAPPIQQLGSLGSF
jgi:hypothetical protein